MSIEQLTGRRGRIQSALVDWRETSVLDSPRFYLSDAVYHAVLENEPDFDGLEEAVKDGILEWAMTPGQDIIEVVYWSIFRAENRATSTWVAPGSVESPVGSPSFLRVA